MSFVDWKLLQLVHAYSKLTATNIAVYVQIYNIISRSLAYTRLFYI